MSGRDSHFELYPDAILKAIYENPEVRRYGAKVGKSVVDEARNNLAKSDNPEAAEVAKRVVYRPQTGQGVTKAKTPTLFQTKWIKPYAKGPIPSDHTYLVGIVASNHPATLFWEEGSRGRKPVKAFRTAFNKIAGELQNLKSGYKGLKFGNKPRPPKGGKR